MASSSKIRLDAYDRPTIRLVGNLNHLLSQLSIPVRLESPLDLTPTLVIAILETIRQERLPISQAAREAKDKAGKTELMKLCLEVLEKEAPDVEESFDAINPNLLARGEWDAVVLAGRALYRVGCKYGIVSESNHTMDAPQVKPPSPSRDLSNLSSSDDSFWAPKTKRANDASFPASSDVRGLQEHNALRSSSPTGQGTVFSPTLSSTPPKSQISLERNSQYLLSNSSSTSSGFRRMTSDSKSPTRTARCIHEVEDALLDEDRGYSSVSPNVSQGLEEAQQPRDQFFRPSISSSPSSKRIAPTVRRTGWIQTVDHDREIQSFENSHSPASHTAASFLSHNSSLSVSTNKASSGRVLTRHNSPTQHTLALMNERAKLLEELARIKGSKRR